jgi:hypothetical protein
MSLFYLYRFKFAVKLQIILFENAMTDVDVKDDVKMASKWRGISIHGYHFKVVFDVPILDLNLCIRLPFAARLGSHRKLVRVLRILLPEGEERCDKGLH